MVATQNSTTTVLYNRLPIDLVHLFHEPERSGINLNRWQARVREAATNSKTSGISPRRVPRREPRRRASRQRTQCRYSEPAENVDAYGPANLSSFASVLLLSASEKLRPTA